MSDKPIHVQVAEALGQHVQPLHEGMDNAQGLVSIWSWVPRYDTDWSATGPLVEKYKIQLAYNGEEWFADVNDGDGEPSCYHVGVSAGFAPCGCAKPTPLLAVCNLIIALGKAGKL